MRWLSCCVLLLVAGCPTRLCKPGTILVSLTLEGTTVHARSLDVTVNGDGKTLSAAVPHADGQSTGTIEIDFPGPYPVNKSVVVVVTARSQTALVLGVGQQTMTLGGTCARLSLVVNSSGVADGGPPSDSGSPLADGGSDGGGSGDMTPPSVCSVAGSVRCNPTNHHFEQHCDVGTGSWVDVACQQTTVPPVYACTDTRNRCIHTGWVQWHGSEGDPKKRSFTTIRDGSGKGEDIVKDNWTGLSWQLKIPSDGLYTWDNGATPAAGSAQAYCAGLSYGGYSDWRVPAPIELVTLVDRTVPETQAMVQLPFARYTFAARFWTSLGLFNSNKFWDAYYIDFSLGDTTTMGTGVPGQTLPTARVRCVR
jgi:hypothetical protein